MALMNIGGNYYDKYHSRNPVARWLMKGFLRNFDNLVAQSGAQTAYEVGCGEGHLSIRLASRGLSVVGCDIDSVIVEQALENAKVAGVEVSFSNSSIYDLETKIIGNPDLVICCEVFEHLEEPQNALDVIVNVAPYYVLVSVPREPIWRILNMARGKYLSDLGNTPGHIQHWCNRTFLKFLQRRLDVIAIVQPLPWVMALCKIRTN